MLKLENDTRPTRRWFERRYPDQPVLYASVATVYTLQAGNLWQRILRQVFRLQCVLIVSEQWLVLTSQFLPRTALVYLSAGLGFLGLGCMSFWQGMIFMHVLLSQDVFLIFLAFLSLCIFLLVMLFVTFEFIWFIFMIRPYCQEIRRVDIQRLEVGREKVFWRLEYPSIRVTTGDETLTIVVPQALPDNLFR